MKEVAEGSSCTKGGFGHWGNFFTLEMVSGGVIIPGDVKTCGCGTWGHGLVLALAVLGLMILKPFPA